MTYTLLTDTAELKVGDRISLKVEENGENRDGFITEFEKGGFWLRFDDDIENEDFISYADHLLYALVARPLVITETYPELAPHRGLVSELQYRVYQGFTIEGIEQDENAATVHIRLLEEGQVYTQTLRSDIGPDGEHVRYI